MHIINMLGLTMVHQNQRRSPPNSTVLIVTKFVEIAVVFAYMMRTELLKVHVSAALNACMIAQQIVIVSLVEIR
ncbi:MAG: hypothetical protein L0H53_01915 [Candidatus Nitrosocosmicus sp.]|nr:hypothetical protein [Candidatus Nitrosocosmicus sp.]MDN5867085.1 hypothetical protein [Candidatus Nitrosocosmicus sp.]